MDTQSPSVMTQLGAAGSCPEIEHKGKIWKVGHPTQRAKAELEKLATQKATRETLSLKELLSPADYGEIFESFRRAVSSGEYKTGKIGWLQTVFSGATAPLFFLSLLREHHPDATEKDAQTLYSEQPEQTMLALEAVVPPFFDMLLKEMDLPPDQKKHWEAAFQRVRPLLIGKGHKTPSTTINAA